MTKILITGTTGFLGPYLVAAARQAGVEFLVGGRSDCDVVLDLSEPGSVRRALDAVPVTHILNAGALSSVGGCERDPELAQRCNAAAVDEFAGQGLRLVQVSTDLVFGGGRAPYLPTAQPTPLNRYGRSKLGGEEAALAAGGLVVRIPLLFGVSCDGRRGATDMLRAAVAEGASLRLFTNEFRSPMHAADAAQSLIALTMGRRVGVVHVAGPERISRWELACRFERAVGIGRHWLPAECTDPQRPRDLTMITDMPISRTLDAALEIC